jgi:hypothetical protein
MPKRPQKKEKTIKKKLGPTGQFVFRLTKVKTKHNGKDEARSTIIGVYDTKEAALLAASSSLVKTALGTIDETITALGQNKELLGQYPGLIQDYRKNAPDEGIVWRFGDCSKFEGDTHTVSIEKVELLSLVEQQTKKKKRRAK